jgi:hypothetical protein
MPFSVKAHVDDHIMTETAETAKEAFAKAIEWHVVARFTNISINDGAKGYSIAEFSAVMALPQIANSAETDAALGLKAKGK